MPTRPHTLQPAVLAVALLAAACGSEATVGGGPRPATRLVVVSAPRQTGLVGALVASQPTVKITDAGGHPRKGVTVDFAVISGGGSVTPASGVSGDDGTVTATWRLGETAGSQQLRATSAELPGAEATFSAQAFQGSGYHIDLKLLSDATDGQWEAFTAAAARIAEVIVGGVDPYDLTGKSCDGTALSGSSQLLILVRLTPIDGRGGILGQAGPCIIPRGRLPAVGVMEFDTADLAALETRGMLQSTILHEMLHVVGFGTVWSSLDLLSGGGTASSGFVGPQALAAALTANGAPDTWTSVPVENCGASSPTPCGAGTRDAHWREPVFASELMTGWISGSAQPLSRTTAGSLADLGYVVDLDAADPFDLATAAALRDGDLVEPDAVYLGDDILHLPIQRDP